MMMASVITSACGARGAGPAVRAGMQNAAASGIMRLLRCAAKATGHVASGAAMWPRTAMAFAAITASEGESADLAINQANARGVDKATGDQQT